MPQLFVYALIFVCSLNFVCAINFSFCPQPFLCLDLFFVQAEQAKREAAEKAEAKVRESFLMAWRVRIGPRSLTHH